jgi:hypothetical protein
MYFVGITKIKVKKVYFECLNKKYQEMAANTVFARERLTKTQMISIS